MTKHKVKIIVHKVIGRCGMGYRQSDEFIIEGYYIKPNRCVPVCIHALNSMMTLLIPFIKGISVKELGIGEDNDTGYVQCPDPGLPYTKGGTVIFELRRERLVNDGIK